MYYPKNKIKTNQITDPSSNFFVVDTGVMYNGFYYSLSNGDLYTGKFPGDGPNQLLAIYNETNDFTSLTKIPYPSSIATSELTPTDQDYKNGFFIRYFSKKRNEYLFNELTKIQHDKLNNPSDIDFNYYKAFSLKWLLTGEKQKVIDFNYYSILKTEEKEKVYGLNDYLGSVYDEYYEIIPTGSNNTIMR